MYIGIVNKSARNTSLDNYVLQPLTYQLNSDTVKNIFNTSNTGYMEENYFQSTLWISRKPAVCIVVHYCIWLSVKITFIYFVLIFVYVCM